MTPNQLIELKLQARDTKASASYLWVHLKSLELTEEFDQTKLRLDDIGMICDEVIEYCGKELKRLDEREDIKKVKVNPRTSRWW